MRTRPRALVLGGALATLMLAPGTPAHGASSHSNVHAMKVFVGYADGLRGSPTVPSPWDDPGVLFIGGGTDFDAGAIRIVNPLFAWPFPGHDCPPAWTRPESRRRVVLTISGGYNEPRRIGRETYGEGPLVVSAPSRHAASADRALSRGTARRACLRRARSATRPPVVRPRGNPTRSS